MSKAPSSLRDKNPTRNNAQQQQNSHLDGHPCAVQPKGKQAAPPLQPLVPNCKLQTGKIQQLEQELLKHTCHSSVCSHRQGTELGRNSGTKVKPEFVSRPASVAFRVLGCLHQRPRGARGGLLWNSPPITQNLPPHSSQSTASTNKRDRSLVKFEPFSSIS